MKDTDIIKALERMAFIESRKGEVQKQKVLESAVEIINRQKAEIENKSRTIIELCDARTEWQVLAIKEFAERLKEESIYGHKGLISAMDVDALVSEMVGERE